MLCATTFTFLLGSIVFDVYADDKTHKELEEYEALYAKLMKQIEMDAVHSGSNLHILTKIYTHQELFENRKEQMTKEIHAFYFGESKKVN